MNKQSPIIIKTGLIADYLMSSCPRCFVCNCVATQWVMSERVFKREKQKVVTSEDWINGEPSKVFYSCTCHLEQIQQICSYHGRDLLNNRILGSKIIDNNFDIVLD